MTKFILYTSLALLSLSTLLYTAGVTYRTVESWMEGVQVYRLTSIGYEVEE